MHAFMHACNSVEYTYAHPRSTVRSALHVAIRYTDSEGLSCKYGKGVILFKPFQIRPAGPRIVGQIDRTQPHALLYWYYVRIHKYTDMHGQMGKYVFLYTHI